MPADISPYEEEETIEAALKKQIEGLRRDEVGEDTKWDSQLSYLLSTALVNYEMERLASVTFAGDEFKAAVKHYVPEGHTFKAFPIQFNHFDVGKMSVAILKNRVGYEVLSAKGDSVRHAMRVKVVPYPEGVCAVWVMLAVRYKAVL